MDPKKLETTDPSDKSVGDSKLVIVGALTTLLSALQLMSGAEGISNYPRLVGWIGVGIGVTTIALRVVTTLPVSFTLPSWLPFKK